MGGSDQRPCDGRWQYNRHSGHSRPSQVLSLAEALSNDWQPAQLVFAQSFATIPLPNGGLFVLGRASYERRTRQSIVASRASGTAPQNRIRFPLPARADCCASGDRSEEHTSELQSRVDLVCRLLL